MSTSRHLEDRQGHGVVVTGPCIAHAYDDLYALERACMHQVMAASTGRPLAPVDSRLATHVAAQIQGDAGGGEEQAQRDGRLGLSLDAGR